MMEAFCSNTVLINWNLKLDNRNESYVRSNQALGEYTCIYKVRPSTQVWVMLIEKERGEVAKRGNESYFDTQEEDSQ